MNIIALIKELVTELLDAEEFLCQIFLPPATCVTRPRPSRKIMSVTLGPVRAWRRQKEQTETSCDRAAEK